MPLKRRNVRPIASSEDDSAEMAARPVRRKPIRTQDEATVIVANSAEGDIDVGVLRTSNIAPKRPRTRDKWPAEMEFGRLEPVNLEASAKDVIPPSASLLRPFWLQDDAKHTFGGLMVMHKKKLEEIRLFLINATSSKSACPKILVLVGPTGASKTTTIHQLCREMGIEIIEWRPDEVAVPFERNFAWIAKYVNACSIQIGSLKQSEEVCEDDF